MGADTLDRVASSRSERSMPSRSARMRGPRAGTAGAPAFTISRPYVIAYAPERHVGWRAMDEPVQRLPDVLVLGAGGTLGIAWLRGLILGLEEAAGLDLRRCEYFVGTSAGAYVSAALAAGHRAGDPATGPGRVPDVAAEPPGGTGAGPVRRAAGQAGRMAAGVAAPLVPLALSATRAGGAAVRAAVLRA